MALPWKVLTLALGNFGPGIAAIVLTYYFEGWPGTSEMLRSFAPSRANLKWYLLAVLSPAAVAALSLWIFDAAQVGGEAIVHWVRVFLMNLLLAPLWEEIGWRGYLLRNLQLTRNSLLSTLLVALVWGIWHIPLYWGGRFGFAVCFSIYIVALSVIFTWFYNKTCTNLAIVVLLHAAINASTISLLGPTMSLLGLRPFLEITGLVSVIAIGILVTSGINLSCRNDLSRVGSTNITPN